MYSRSLLRINLILMCKIGFKSNISEMIPRALWSQLYADTLNDTGGSGCQLAILAHPLYVTGLFRRLLVTHEGQNLVKRKR